MPSFTTSLKDTLSELTSKASSSNTNSSSNPQQGSSTSQDQQSPSTKESDDKNWTQASSQAARAYDDYRQGHSCKATREIQEAAKSAASAYKSSGGKFDAQDFAGGLVSGLIPGAKSGSGDGSVGGSGGLLPVNLKGEDLDGGEKEDKGEKGGESGGHEEGVTSMKDQGKEKSSCGCSTGTDAGLDAGTDARTDTKPPTCCATTGSCADCKGCKASKDKGEDCLCQCQNQNQKWNTGAEGCACQRQDDGSNTQQQDNGQKPSSFKDISTASGLGAGAGAGTEEDHGLNNPLTSDAATTGQSTVHDFGGRAGGLDTGSGDFNPSPSAVTAATDELIAGAKGESEGGGGRGTGAYTSGGLGGEFGGQD